MRNTEKKRIIRLYERKQRGCTSCLHVEHGRHMGSTRLACPFDKCPYKVLEKYETYEEFMASEDCKILVDGFFHNVASCYELGNGNVTVRQIYSGKDFRGFM